MMHDAGYKIQGYRMQDSGCRIHWSAIVTLDYYPAFVVAKAEYTDEIGSLYHLLKNGWNTLFKPESSDQYPVTRMSTKKANLKKYRSRYLQTKRL